MTQYYGYLELGVLVFLVLGILFGLIRAIRGPRRADRILGINIIGSCSTAAIAVLAVYLKESWLLDVCIVYCLISFLAVVVLTRIHMAEGREPASEEEKRDE